MEDDHDKRTEEQKRSYDIQLITFDLVAKRGEFEPIDILSCMRVSQGCINVMWLERYQERSLEVVAHS